MAYYLVRWEIDIVAESPQEAAEKARRCQTRAGTQATIFDVFDADPGSQTVKLKFGRLLARIDLTFPEETVITAEEAGP
jgi:hypothetical protein